MLDVSQIASVCCCGNEACPPFPECVEGCEVEYLVLASASGTLETDLGSYTWTLVPREEFANDDAIIRPGDGTSACVWGYGSQTPARGAWVLSLAGSGPSDGQEYVLGHPGGIGGYRCETVGGIRVSRGSCSPRRLAFGTPVIVMTINTRGVYSKCPGGYLASELLPDSGIVQFQAGGISNPELFVSQTVTDWSFVIQ